MIISLGEALIDFISLEGLKFNGFPGGSPYNTAIAISRLGTPVQFLGRISRDMFGNQLIKYLKKNSVGTDLIQRTKDKTTLSFVQKQTDGQAEYAFFANSTADRNWNMEDLKSVRLPEEAKIIHFGSISLSQEPCGSSITDFLKNNHKGLLLSFDPNIRPSLVEDRDKFMKRFKELCRISTIVKLSDEDLEWLYPSLTTDNAVKNILESGVSLIALTTGKKGALLINKNNRLSSPLFDLPVADTIGAGDTFHGALLSYLYKKNWIDRNTLNSRTEEQLLTIGNYANKAAGINCSRSGANPPTKLEMEKDWGVN
ncbi:MAG: carbohydrate kinase [Spirochaetales bacterium]|nr:carbohydrate kinase [Spirochaetales bacterium]